jgi:hypothetical protein
VADAVAGRLVDHVPPPDLANAATSGMAARWQDVMLADLPAAASEAALSGTASASDVLAICVDPEVVAEAGARVAQSLVAELEEHCGQKLAQVAVGRWGIGSTKVETLQEIADRLGITRERVRQIERTAPEPMDVRAIGQGPLRWALAAWFDLNPRDVLLESDINRLAPDRSTARCLTAIADAIATPIPYPGAWSGSPNITAAIEDLLDSLDQLEGCPGWSAAVNQLTDRSPRAASTLDLEVVLTRICSLPAVDIGPGLDGRLTAGWEALQGRTARKIVTYLRARTHPIAPGELAQVIGTGKPPFESFHRPPVSEQWIVDCVQRMPDLLSLLDDGTIWFGPAVEDRDPPRSVATLRDALVAHGRPMRMQDLCDEAALAGMSRNQVGQLIHSSRAACCLMVRRGIVGLVGRDEDADPSAYTPAHGSRDSAPRPGFRMGFDALGRIRADVVVARSVREQGLAVPFPLSLALFDAEAMVVTGSSGPRPMQVLPNGSLSAPGLDPQAHIQLAFEPRSPRTLLVGADQVAYEAFADEGTGRSYPNPLPPVEGRPGWVHRFLTDAQGEADTPLSRFVERLPADFRPGLRLRALYALVALGALERADGGWVTHSSFRLPPALGSAFRQSREDPRTYDSLPPESRAPFVWLVSAGWLTASHGWSTVRPTGTVEIEHELDPASDKVLDGERSELEARLGQAIYEVLDHVRHRGTADPLDVTVRFVRRCLVSLGHTGPGAIRETRTAGESALEIVTPEGAGLLIAKPLDSEIGTNDIEYLRQRAEGPWLVTNGTRLCGAMEDAAFEIDLKSESDAPRVLKATLGFRHPRAHRRI